MAKSTTTYWNPLIPENDENNLQDKSWTPDIKHSIK